MAAERNARITTFWKFDLKFEENELVVKKTMVEVAFSKYAEKEASLNNTKMIDITFFIPFNLYFINQYFSFCSKTKGN